MKKTILIATALAIFSAGSAFAQPSVSDTIKLVVIGGEDAGGVQDGSFGIQVLISHDSAIAGGGLGFTWNDTANWRLDSIVLGPEVSAWTFPSKTDTAFANSIGMFITGGVDFGAASMPAGTDQLWCEFWFSLKAGNNWGAGKEMTVDSTFFPPSGPFLVVYTGLGATEVTPIFTGAKIVTFNDVQVNSDGVLPATFELSQNYPNPFNPSTKIDFSVAGRSHVDLAIYNVLGQRVKTLVNEELAPESYTVTWNGVNDHGQQVASGLYFYKLTAGDVVVTRKMMLMK